MTRTVPEHSKSAVNRAGKAVHDSRLSQDEREGSRLIISNFRSAHAYPLIGVTMNVRQRALRIDENAIIAQRMKRLPTILDKLERYPDMNVARMQDLGGCRVIFDNVAQVKSLVDALTGAKRAKNKIKRIYDYIDDSPGPTATGYRGVHLVYEYGASQTEFLGLQIEVQVRTTLQHAWATAVETMDLFSNSRLKYDEADPALKRYFVVVSSLMAIHEGVSLVPGAEADQEVLRSELVELEKRLGVLQLLQGYADVIQEHASSRGAAVLTLELKRKERQLKVNRHANLAEARSRLERLEALDDENLDAVMIQVKKIGQMRAAYPNYYANTSQFSSFVREEIVGAQ